VTLCAEDPHRHVSAMQEELSAALAIVPDEHKESAGARDDWVGHLHGQEVGAVLSRSGKVAATW
jgi:adenosylhomocysteine nucleosidase